MRRVLQLSLAPLRCEFSLLLGLAWLRLSLPIQQRLAICQQFDERAGILSLLARIGQILAFLMTGFVGLVIVQQPGREEAYRASALHATTSHAAFARPR